MATLGGTVVMFGGEDATGHLDDTWTFDGTTWTQISPWKQQNVAGPGAPALRAYEHPTRRYRWRHVGATRRASRRA